MARKPYGPEQNLPDIQVQKRAKNPTHDAITGAVFGALAGNFAGGTLGARMLGSYVGDFMPHAAPFHLVGGLDVYSIVPLAKAYLQYHAHYPMIDMPFVFAGLTTAVFAGLGAWYGYRRSEKARRMVEQSEIHGSAHWATLEEVQDAALLPRRNQQASRHICYVGGFRDGNRIRYLRHTGTEHIIAFAPTRSGKGVGLVLPTLFAWKDSVVIHDIKGENYELTAGYRRRIGNRILRFAPGDLDDRGCHFNPLESIRLRTQYEIKDVQNIATMIVDPDGKGLNDHWSKTGFALMTSVILHVMYAEPDKTLRGVAAYLNNPELQHVDDAFAAMIATEHDPQGLYGWRDHAQQPTRVHPVIAQSAREMLNKADNEKSGVISTMQSFLSLYRDPIVASWTEYSDFSIQDLQDADDPVALYLVTSPEDKLRLKPLIRLVLNLIASKFTSSERLVAVDGRMKCIGKHRLLLLLDEFPSLGKMDVFLESIAFLAGYNVKLYLITQDFAQIKGSEHGYGTEGANAIIGNCHVRVVYAPNQIDTAEWVSKTLGKKTITSLDENQSFSGSVITQAQGGSRSTRHQARDLLTSDEVMRLKGPKKGGPNGDQILEPGDMIVLIAGFPPVYGQQMLYFFDKTFMGRAKMTAPGYSDVMFLPPPPDDAAFVAANPEADAASQALASGEADAKSQALLGQLDGEPVKAQPEGETDTDEQVAEPAETPGANDPLAALSAIEAQAGDKERDADREQISGLL